MKNRLTMHSIRNTIIISLCPCVLIFILLPLDAYFMAISEFSETWKNVILYFLPWLIVSFTVTVCAMLLLRRMNPWLCDFFILYIVLSSVCLVIQTFLLNFNIPPLDGNFGFYFDNQKSIRGLGEAACLIAVLCIGTIFNKRIISKAAMICTLCVALPLVNIVSVASNAERMVSLQYSFGEVVDSAVFSNNRNTVILSLDTIDAKVAAEIIAENEEIKEKLSGFTNFTDNIASHWLTYHALPALMHGELFDGLSYQEHFAKIFESDNSIIKNHVDNGYTVSAHWLQGIANHPLASRQEEDADELRAHGLLAWSLFDFSLFRACPLALKYSLLQRIKTTSGDRTTNFVVNNHERNVYPRLAARLEHLSDMPALNAYHTMGGHVPFYIHGDRTLRSDNPRWDDLEAYKEQIKATLLYVVDFLDALKKRGLYRNSVIAVIADHGSTSGAVKYANLPGAVRALCMVKPRGVNDDVPYRESKFPMSSAYFPALMNALCFSQDSAVALLDFEKDIPRVPRIFRHIWKDVITDTVINSDGAVETARKSQPVIAPTDAEQWELGKEYSTRATVAREQYAAPRYIATGFYKDNGALIFSVKNGTASGRIGIRVPLGVSAVDVLLRSVASTTTGSLAITNLHDGSRHVELLNEDTLQSGIGRLDLMIPSLVVSNDDMLNLEFEFIGASDSNGELRFDNWRLLDTKNRTSGLVGNITSFIYTDDGYVEITGWGFDESTIKPLNWYSVSVNDRENMSFTFPMPRGDVAHALKNANFALSGFKCTLDRKEDEIKTLEVHAGATIDGLKQLNTGKELRTRFSMSNNSSTSSESREDGNVIGWIDKIGIDNSIVGDPLSISGWAAVDDGEGGTFASTIAIVIDEKAYTISRNLMENSDRRGEFQLRLPCTWDKSLPVTIRFGESRFFSIEMTK